MTKQEIAQDGDQIEIKNEFEKATIAICERLDVKLVSEKVNLRGHIRMWATIGLKLAFNEQEFSKINLNKKGRPKKETSQKKMFYYLNTLESLRNYIDKNTNINNENLAKIAKSSGLIKDGPDAITIAQEASRARSYLQKDPYALNKLVPYVQKKLK